MSSPPNGKVIPLHLSRVGFGPHATFLHYKYLQKYTADHIGMKDKREIYKALRLEEEELARQKEAKAQGAFVPPAPEDIFLPRHGIWGNEFGYFEIINELLKKGHNPSDDVDDLDDE